MQMHHSEPPAISMDHISQAAAKPTKHHNIKTKTMKFSFIFLFNLLYNHQALKIRQGKRSNTT